MQRLFNQFSFPGGIPSHVAPETPGSINEGGELGYSLRHAFGAVFDNPGSHGRLAWSVTGRRRRDRSPTSWHRTSSSIPARDGAVLPILHLNGYKIADPTVLARIGRRGAARSFSAATATSLTSSPATIRRDASADGGDAGRGHRRDPAHPATDARQRCSRAAALADDRVAHAQGLDRTEGSRRQAGRGHIPRAPGAARRGAGPIPTISGCSSSGCAATGPRSCSTRAARCGRSSLSWRPKGERRMGANPHANGGLLLKDLALPDFREYAVAVPRRARSTPKTPACSDDSCATSCELNQHRAELPRVRAGRDQLQPARTRCSKSTERQWMAERIAGDDHLAPDGRVMEVLSEHHVSGLARRISADRPARLLQLL